MWTLSRLHDQASRRGAMRAKPGGLDLARLMAQFQLHVDEANGSHRYAPCRTNNHTRDGDATLEPCRPGAGRVIAAATMGNILCEVFNSSFSFSSRSSASSINFRTGRLEDQSHPHKQWHPHRRRGPPERRSLLTQQGCHRRSGLGRT